jgi:hypothetical protein
VISRPLSSSAVTMPWVPPPGAEVAGGEAAAAWSCPEPFRVIVAPSMRGMMAPPPEYCEPAVMSTFARTAPEPLYSRPSVVSILVISSLETLKSVPSVPEARISRIVPGWTIRPLSSSTVRMPMVPPPGADVAATDAPATESTYALLGTSSGRTGTLGCFRSDWRLSTALVVAMRRSCYLRDSRHSTRRGVNRSSP